MLVCLCMEDGVLDHECLACGSQLDLPRLSPILSHAGWSCKFVGKILLFHGIPLCRSFNSDADLIFGEGLQNRVLSVGRSDYAITKRYYQSLTVADPISRAGEREHQV